MNQLGGIHPTNMLIYKGHQWNQAYEADPTTIQDHKIQIKPLTDIRHLTSDFFISSPAGSGPLAINIKIWLLYTKPKSPTYLGTHFLVILCFHHLDSTPISCSAV
jgi:hypothetical protein